MIVYAGMTWLFLFIVPANAVNLNSPDSVTEATSVNCALANPKRYSTFNEFQHALPGGIFSSKNNSGSLTSDSVAGLKILSLRRTAADMMLDLRFKIQDVETTKRIMDRKTPVYLIDQVSGYRYRVPVTTKLGPLRQTTKKIDPNKVYFIMFANPGRSIKKCDVVTVMIGDASINNIIVE